MGERRGVTLSSPLHDALRIEKVASVGLQYKSLHRSLWEA
jgi:hypothetical protein